MKISPINASGEVKSLMEYKLEKESRQAAMQHEKNARDTMRMLGSILK